MVSKTCIQIMGFQVNVFGLEEYKKLPSNTPLGVIFGLHGKLNDQQQLEKSCHALCSLNEKRRPQDRYIMAVSFDGPNHGSRRVYKEIVEIETSSTYDRQALGMGLNLYSIEISRTMSQLMDVFEIYVFGPHHRHPVEKWGAMAFSLGAHAIFMTIAKDPRITMFISMAGTAYLIGLVKSYYPYFRLPPDFHIKTEYYEWSETYRTDIYERLNNINLLAIYGSKDKVVNPVIGEKLIKTLRKVHSGRENQDWKVITIPELDHYISRSSIAEAVQWTERWMMRKETELTAKL